MVQIYKHLNILIIKWTVFMLKCFNTLGQIMLSVGKMFQYPQFVYCINLSLHLHAHLACYQDRKTDQQPNTQHCQVEPFCHHHFQ